MFPIVAAGAALAGSAAFALKKMSGMEEERNKLYAQIDQRLAASKASAKDEKKDEEDAESEGQFWVLPLPKFSRSNKKLEFADLANKQTLKHVDFAGKRVLIRVDYNVPFKNGVIKDTSRIDATLDTLRTILDVEPAKKPKCVVLICHLGRPGGKFKSDDFSLAAVAKVLEGYLKNIAPVRFLDDCVGSAVEAEINASSGGTVFMLENLRFHIEETGTGVTAKGKKVKASRLNFERFRRALSNLGDVFVFEAFGAAHRPHASVSGINIHQRVAGNLVAKELSYFSKVLGNPQRPFLAIVGGAKVSDKIKVLHNMLDLVDELIIGGGMTYTFKKVLHNVNIGASIFDKEGAKVVKSIMEKAKEKNVKIHFAIDHVVADRFAIDAKVDYVTDETGIPDGWMALDVGPKSRALFSEVIGRAQTILWNGPLGVFEFPAFAKGTEQAMFDMVAATKRGATTIIGGGDTGSASNKFVWEGKPVSAQVSHVSTGGGSSLVLMEGTMLPGVDHLSNVSELPPANLDLKLLWNQIQTLKKENAQLRDELERVRAKVFPEEAEVEDDE